MKVLVTLALVAGLVNVGFAATPNQSATTIQTETTTLTAVSDVSKPKSAWSFKAESENAKAIDNRGAYNGDIEAYQYLHVGYKPADKLSTTLVSTWTQRYGYGFNEDGESNSSNTTFEDLHVRLTRSDLFATGPLSWTAQGRLYLPTSDSSQDADQIAQVRAYLIGGMEVAKGLGLELIVSPRYYIYSQGKRDDGKNDWRILNSAGLKYNITDALAVESTLGVYVKDRVGAGNAAYFQDYSTSVYYTVNKNVEINAGVRAIDGGLDIDTSGVELYNNKVSEYYGILTLSM